MWAGVLLNCGVQGRGQRDLAGFEYKGGPKNAGTFISRKSENHILPWSQKKVPSSGNTSMSVQFGEIHSECHSYKH